MQSRVEDILQAMIDGTSSSELPKPQSRNEDLLLQVLDKMNEGGGGVQPDWNQSSTTADDYIKNKPAIRQAANDGGILENSALSASGTDSHAEGITTTASGMASHAEGLESNASGGLSHAEGNGTIANHKAQHTFGEYNIADTSSAGSNQRGEFVEIVGNGTDGSDRSNARTLDWEGNEEVAGDVIAYGCGGANPISLSDLKGQVDQAVSDVQVDGVSVVTNGVANVPVADTSTAGVVKVNSDLGTAMGAGNNVGIITTYPASSSNIKSPGNSNLYKYRPIVPYTQHESTFYGLAKAAGDTTQSASSNTVGTYTDDAKAAIKNMLGVSTGMNIVTVSGTAPTIAAQTNTQYLCGEVVSLNFTPAATGISDVIFTSGSTMTVLTLPAAVKMPDWFEVEANKIYEICVTNGVYGAVMVWENA